jgi:hypothetical protein
MEIFGDIAGFGVPFRMSRSKKEWVPTDLHLAVNLDERAEIETRTELCHVKKESKNGGRIVTSR